MIQWHDYKTNILNWIIWHVRIGSWYIGGDIIKFYAKLKKVYDNYRSKK